MPLGLCEDVALENQVCEELALGGIKKCGGDGKGVGLSQRKGAGKRSVEGRRPFPILYGKGKKGRVTPLFFTPAARKTKQVFRTTLG